MSWPARTAFSIAGITLSSYPTMPVEDRPARREPGDEVGPHLLLDRPRAPAGVAQLADGGGEADGTEADERATAGTPGRRA